ncbi:MAG: small basic protein [Verrucomicrobia bacterium]|jgi:small basic protein (TIGR04137 family)|nr:small basic protein [Verrucomicrobiota bacterium]
MSKHPSYGKVASTGQKRNVFKRFERVRLMKSRDQWKDRSSVLSLPKTKVPT